MSTEINLHPLLQSFDPAYLPLGVYVVTPDGCFVFCNAHARRLLHLPPEGTITQKIGDFYAHAEERPRVLARVLEAEAQGSFFENEILHFKVEGRDLFVENNCRSLRDAHTQEVIGFIGSLVDVTQEHKYSEVNKALHQKIADLTTDIGRVLHANSSTLVMVHQALNAAIQALGPCPFQDDGLPSNEEIDQALQKPAQEAAQALHSLLEATDAAQRQEALPEVLWEELRQQLPVLRDFIGTIPIQESRPNTLRVIARRILEICERIPPRKLSKELQKDLARSAAPLERLAAMIAALQTRTAVIQMDYTLRSLREFITTDVRRTEIRQRLPVAALIENAHKQLAEFARCSRVKVRFENGIAGAAVLGVERDLSRALTNILHNGIKYSWHRDQGKLPWVWIRMFRTQATLGISFENWGVPIAPEEIENKLIFNLGYRGEWSKDRGRLGTGIGLTDALDVAQKHGGTLTVESRPARVHAPLSPESEGYYNQPFITTVTMFLPEAQVEEAKVK
jgi:signal transduction histidine kinase